MTAREVLFAATQMDTVEHMTLLHSDHLLHRGKSFRELENHLIQTAALLTMKIVVRLIVPQMCVTAVVVLEVPFRVGVTNKDGIELMELLDVGIWKVQTSFFNLLPLL